MALENQGTVQMGGGQNSAGFDVKHLDRFFIGGAWTVPSSDARIDVTTPAAEELFFSVAEAREADVNQAVAAARQAFDNGPWPRISHAERAHYLNAIADGIAERAGTIGRIWTNEMGVIPAFAEPLVMGASATFRYYAKLADSFPFVERHTPAAGNGGLARPRTCGRCCGDYSMEWADRTCGDKARACFARWLYGRPQDVARSTGGSLCAR